MTGPAAGPSDPASFRSAMARWATGVSVVTAHAGEEDAGLTVNALLSVSLEPPSLLVSLQRDVDTLPVLRRSGAFAVNFLGASQRSLSERFARAVPSREKFEGLPVRRGLSGAPLLEGGLASLECRVVSATELFDHVLVVGRVERIEEGPDASPLLFFRGAYAEDDGAGRLRLGRRSGEPRR
jgi:3-hydroxy-9,10-secoandrosta-1,3,5(10)-triene-9,17-dione monooxygenase reductase component